MERLAAALRALAGHAVELAGQLDPLPVREVPGFRRSRPGHSEHWEDEETSWHGVVDAIRSHLAPTKAWEEALGVAPACFAAAPLPVQHDLAIKAFLVRYLERAEGEWSDDAFATVRGATGIH